MVHFITTSTNSAKKLLAQRAVDLIYYNEYQPSNTRIVQRLLCRENILLAIDRRTARQAGASHRGEAPLEAASGRYPQAGLPPLYRQLFPAPTSASSRTPT